jgi:hypothetical protein
MAKHERAKSISAARKQKLLERRHHIARNALDESMAKIHGVLGLITSFAHEEHFEDVSGACWLLYDELDRLDDAVSDAILSVPTAGRSE